MPATTWALVTTTFGATTKPVPSCTCPHPTPCTFTVDGDAARVAARRAGAVGSVTGPVVAGGSWANTAGKPWVLISRWMRANTDGAGGRTPSSAPRIADPRISELSLGAGALTGMLATSHEASRVAAKAMIAPRPASAAASRARWSTRQRRTPNTRPTPPRIAANPKTTISETTALATDPDTASAIWGASSAPMKSPSQNPPNDSTWMAAPSRTPWTIDATSSTRRTMSTRFTGGPWAGGGGGEGRSSRGPGEHRPPVGTAHQTRRGRCMYSPRSPIFPRVRAVKPPRRPAPGRPSSLGDRTARWDAGPVIRVSDDRFEELVAEALDGLPAELGEAMDNVSVFVEDRSRRGNLLGLYEGIPLTQRHSGYSGMVMPDRITIFRQTICATCDTEDEVVRQVRRTVGHEAAHHLGIDDARLNELGWD